MWPTTTGSRLTGVANFTGFTVIWSLQNAENKNIKHSKNKNHDHNNSSCGAQRGV
jgi:hypothetical protein